MTLHFWVKDVMERERLGKAAKFALLPFTAFSKIYCSVMTARRDLYRKGILPSTHVGVPTICIGNITLGGTGKTPLVETTCRIIKEAGVLPSVVSRGYGGELEGQVAIVSDTKRVLLNAVKAGDEPHLLARRLTGIPVVIGAARVKAATEAVAKLGVGAIVMDDGYQHLRIARDLNIVAIDANAPFGNRYCLPRGMLREPPTALKDAHLIILTRAGKLTEAKLEKLRAEIASYNSSAPLLRAFHHPEKVVDLSSGEEMELETLKGRKVVAFAGIGKPEAFFNEVERLGSTLTEAVPFPDHHRFEVEDMEKLVRWAKVTNAEALITTEKDGVRLDEVEKLPLPVWVLTTKMELAQEDESVFKNAILKVIGRKNMGTAQ